MRQQQILSIVKANEKINIVELQNQFGVSRRTITRDLLYLKKSGFLIRVGSDKNGSWMITKVIKGL